ncbi:MAG: hypothetical protein HY565_04935 [Candidatus Kerfeldbacteria bacterium]|nr:hypothetical protein [Candidatus Kerfeldbacteria bacterium]
MKFAPELARRGQIHRRNAAEKTPHGETWGVNTGGYAQQLFFNEPLVSHRSERELVGVEQRFYDQLRHLLEIKAATGQPTMMLDFGGMFGLSLARLAAQPELHAQLETGKLALVITNLSLNVDEALKSQKKRPDQLGQKEIDLIREQRPWLHYVQGDAAAIRRQTITLPDGSTLPLAGNVDLIHEWFALAHGVKNDTDIPRLGKLLSPYGSLWLSSSTNMEPSNRYGEVTHADRVAADALGRANLAELGLTELDLQGRKSPYHIFVQPGTPPII